MPVYLEQSIHPNAQPPYNGQCGDTYNSPWRTRPHDDQGTCMVRPRKGNYSGVERGAGGEAGWG